MILGPLLPETLDVRRIPFTQARELTVSLTGMILACVAGAWNYWAQEKTAREKETRVSPSHVPVLSFAHYFQAPATQPTCSIKNYFIEINTLHSSHVIVSVAQSGLLLRHLV